MFEGFDRRRIATSGADIDLLIGGSGPPLLLLHGYPQTRTMWHLVAPRLAERFTIVCPDLRGYGRSSKPPGDPEHATYSKRESARDMVEVMTVLGFEGFGIAGHDRGGRVGHRLALDHPDRVERLAVLDIAPTREIFRGVDQATATAMYHWFFLIQPAPFPETIIGRDPEWFLRWHLRHWSGGADDFFDPEALADYVVSFSEPATIHATCEDYRAAASIDLAHDDEAPDARVTCPVLALWGNRWPRGDIGAPWRDRVVSLESVALPCGHFVAEEAPDETVAELTRFFRG
jgi:haloacetate dehalogenase